MFIGNESKFVCVRCFAVSGEGDHVCGYFFSGDRTVKHHGVGEQCGRWNDRNTLNLSDDFRAQLHGKLVGV